MLTVLFQMKIILSILYSWWYVCCMYEVVGYLRENFCKVILGVGFELKYTIIYVQHTIVQLVLQSSTFYPSQ